jgi:hypothetical protein
MHVLVLVVFGLIALAVFAVGGRVFGGDAGMMRATRIFIWVWLIACLINAGIGVLSEGIPFVNEFGAFVPIFGVPAAASWYLARRLGAKG